MEIIKVFSNVHNPEEVMYSVMLTEEEYKLFARADYEGLSQEAADALRKERSKIAEELARKRRLANRPENKYRFDLQADRFVNVRDINRDNALFDARIEARQARDKIKHQETAKRIDNMMGGPHRRKKLTLSRSASKNNFNLGTTGKAAAGAVLAAGALYGAKKLWDKDKEQ